MGPNTHLQMQRNPWAWLFTCPWLACQPHSFVSWHLWARAVTGVLRISYFQSFNQILHVMHESGANLYTQNLLFQNHLCQWHLQFCHISPETHFWSRIKSVLVLSWKILTVPNQIQIFRHSCQIFCCAKLSWTWCQIVLGPSADRSVP